MKLTGLSWYGFGIPFRRQYFASDTSAAVRYGLLVFIHDASGQVGVGEASPVGAGSLLEVQRLATLLESLGQRLLWHNPDATEAMSLVPTGSTPPTIRLGMEMALLDIEGKAQGRTVADLLGGRSTPLLVNALIAEEMPRDAAAMAKDAVTQGFTTLKLKIAQGTLAQDDALVSEVRRAVGPGIKLRVDANEGWSPTQAIEAVRRLARYDLEYVEQPVPGSDMAGLAEVRRNVSVAIAADEALHSVDALRHLLSVDAADVLVVKVGRIGGIQDTLEMVRLAGESDKPVVATSSLESDVGIAASAHVAAILPPHSFAHGLSTGMLLERCLVAPPFSPERGMLPALTKPGLGVDVDMEEVTKYSIGITGSVGY